MAITKAAGLYRGALDRCKDADGRETLKHRIKYTDKIKVKGMKRRQQGFFHRMTVKEGNAGHTNNSEKGEDTDSTYKEHLEQGCKAQQTGDLNTAEHHFAAALKSVHGKEESKEVDPLRKMSDVYLKRGMQSKDGDHFAKAAALCNAALVRSKTEDQDDIKQTIQLITQSFVKHVLGITHTVDIDDVNKHKTMLKEDRHQVEKEIEKIEQNIDPYSLDDDDPNIREVESKRAEAIRILFQTILHQRRTFIVGLVDECMEIMGPPPCKYAMIGLGSQATGLVTPYSDLEFAILIQEETENNVRYFRNLTHYLHLKVISLGETILPAMAIKSLNDFISDDPLDNWFYDSVTPRGFAFDGAMPHACKTPLGRGKTNELIRTPSNMAKLLEENVTFHLKKGYHLASVLGNVSLISGEQMLIDEYTALWTKLLQEDQRKIPLSLANTILKENSPTFDRHVLSASLLNVKKEIYRFSSLALSCWPLLRGIQPTTIWDTIAKMNRNGVINKENAHHLMVMISISAELRLRTYMNNHGQVENMSVLSSMPTETDLGEKVRKVFYISNPKQLMRYYYTATPLKQFVSKITESPEASLTLFDNSLQLKSDVYECLCDYQNLKTCRGEILQNHISKFGKASIHPDIARSLIDFGRSCRQIGNHKKAISYLEQSLQMTQTIYGKNTAHLDIAASLDSLGSTWIELGDFKKAISYYEQSLQMMRHIYGEKIAHPNIAASLRNLGTAWMDIGDHKKAVSYHEQSLQMTQTIYGENAARPDIATSLGSLCTAWIALGDFQKAVSCGEKSLHMMQSIFGESTAHIDIARLLDNLGTVCGDLGDYTKAVSYHSRSLQMKKIIYGKKTAAHPEFASSLNNLGINWMSLGEYKMAISYYEQSLQMKQSIYSENTAHPDIASSLNNLGNAWVELGDYKMAVSYHEQSLQMWRSIYGKNTAHPYIASSLNNLGNAWRDLGDHKRAVMYHEQSLQVGRTIHGEKTAHPDIASSLNNVGNDWAVLGDHIRAVSYHEQSLKMRRSIYGKNTPHPDIAASLNNLGNSWRGLGDHKKAVSYYEQSLQMRRSIYGWNTLHADIASSLDSLGVACGDLGDHQQAISYHEQSLQMGMSIFGKNTPHPDISKSLCNLGVAWGDLGDHRKAISYHEQSLQMERTIYGEKTAHPAIAGSLGNLGNVYASFGDLRKAINYHEQSLQMNRSIYGKNTPHPDIAKSLGNLGSVYANFGDLSKAISYLEQSLQMMLTIYGDNSAHPYIVMALMKLSIVWGKLGDHQKAFTYFHQATMMKRVP
ncbi:uncharacterized protein [Branchiostoma lanceolatum]|uniref:uncharacterized protein n=1 Tax=Branchiostoma lanceolatum TaxID=7740 RepID=UPI0034572585